MPRDTLDAARSLDAREADHRAVHPMLLQRRKIRRVQQFDGLQPHLFPRDAEIVEADLRIAPLADGMIDAPFSPAGGIGRGQA